METSTGDQVIRITVRHQVFILTAAFLLPEMFDLLLIHSVSHQQGVPIQARSYSWFPPQVFLATVVCLIVGVRPRVSLRRLRTVSIATDAV